MNDLDQQPAPEESVPCRTFHVEITVAERTVSFPFEVQIGLTPYDFCVPFFRHFYGPHHIRAARLMDADRKEIMR